MKSTGKIILKKGKEFSIQRFHPWIFSGAIGKIDGAVVDGAWVEVQDFRNQTLGFGHYQNGSIAVRMLSFDSLPPNENFWSQKIAAAIAVRKSAGLPDIKTNAFRLIHAEGDGLPGLVVDYYAGAIVVQAHSVGMHQDRIEIVSALREAFGSSLTSIYYKSQSTLPGKMREPSTDEYLFGQPLSHNTIRETPTQTPANQRFS